jgi:hypothetical protein
MARLWGKVSDQHWSIERGVLRKPLLDVTVGPETDVEAVSLRKTWRHG